MFESKTWYKEVTILTVISFAIEFAVGFVISLALVSVDQVYLFQTDIFAIYEAIIAVVIFTGLAIWLISFGIRTSVPNNFGNTHEISR